MEAATIGSKRWSGYQIYLVSVLLLVSVFNYLDRFVLSIAQESLKRDLTLTDVQIGLLGGPAFAILYSTAGIPIARLAERGGRVRLLTACITLWSLMTAVCGAAQSFAQLALCRVGVGAGEGGAIPISQAILAENFEVRQRGRVMSILASAGPVAAIITPLIVGFFTQLYGWRFTFVAVGLPGVALALLVLLTLRDPHRPAGSGRGRSFLADLSWLVHNRAFLFVLIAAALNGVGFNGISLFEVAYLLRNHGLTLVEASTIKSVAGIVGVISAILGGVLADRYAGPRGRSYLLVPAIGGMLTTTFYVAAFSGSNRAIVVACLIAGAFAYSLKNGPLFAAVQNIVAPRMRATGAAVFMMASTVVGSMVGPPIAGFLSDTFAAAHFGEGVGSFAILCPGGGWGQGVLPSVTARCQAASGAGLRVALIFIAFSYLVAALCLWIASRTVALHPDTEAAVPI